jgi:hypothetical protein
MGRSSLPMGECGPRRASGRQASVAEFLDKADAPVLIDPEGGRVVQLTPPLWPLTKRPAQLVTAQIARRTGYDHLERSTGEGFAQ